MEYRKIYKHHDKLYIIKNKTPISSFTKKDGKIHLDLVQGMQEYFKCDHTLKTELHFLFAETIEEVEFEELCHE